jgi:hypothetical protein
VTCDFLRSPNVGTFRRRLEAPVAKLADRPRPQLSILVPVDDERLIVFERVVGLKIGTPDYGIKSTSSPVTINFALTGLAVRSLQLLLGHKRDPSSDKQTNVDVPRLRKTAPRPPKEDAESSPYSPA